MSDRVEEFNKLVAEVNRLRQLVYEMNDDGDDSFQEKVTELAKNQLSTIRTVNECLQKTVDNAKQLKERLETQKSSIVMPNQQSAKNFKELSETAFELLEKSVQEKKHRNLPDKNFFENEKMKLTHLVSANLNSEELNRSYRAILEFYSNGESEIEESADSTINTIISEDVSTSSPI